MEGDELQQAAAPLRRHRRSNIPMVGGAHRRSDLLASEGVGSLVPHPGRRDRQDLPASEDHGHGTSPALAESQPGGQPLPGGPIAGFHRSDGTGDTDNFTPVDGRGDRSRRLAGREPGSGLGQPKGGQGSGVLTVLPHPGEVDAQLDRLRQTVLRGDQGMQKAASVDNGGGTGRAERRHCDPGLASAKVTPNLTRVRATLDGDRLRGAGLGRCTGALLTTGSSASGERR